MGTFVIRSQLGASFLLGAVALVSSAGSALAADWTVHERDLRKNVVKTDLDAKNTGLNNEIRTEKYDKMSVSPFTFYRGTAHLYYRDLDDQGLIGDSDFPARMP